LAHEALRKKLTRGESLFLQGDTANEMFLIKGGRVKLSKILENTITANAFQRGFSSP